MSSLINQARSLAWAFAISGLALLIVLGAFTTSLAQTGMSYSDLIPTSTVTPIVIPTNVVAVSTALPEEPEPAVSPTPTAIVLLEPTPTACNYPDGWIAIDVTPEDSFEDIAAEYGLSVDELVNGNCLLFAPTSLESSVLFAPAPTLQPTEVVMDTQTINTAQPTNTPKPVAANTSTPCSPPANWVSYIIQPGDTLYSLARTYGLTVGFLQLMNCLPRADSIYAGQVIYVPYAITATPSPTRISTSTKTPVPSVTSSATSAPTQTPTPTQTTQALTNTPTDTSTQPPTPTGTSTPTQTATFTPTSSATPVPTQTFTQTPTPTATNTR